MPHFTLTYGPIGPLIHAYIAVSLPRHNALTKAGLPVPSAVVVKALVDTGASNTVIDPTVVSRLELAPKRIAQTITPTTGTAPHKCFTYDVGLHIPLATQGSFFSKAVWEVTCLELKHQGFEALLGRDLLAETILVFDGRAGTFAMAF
jgi:hypothetical protein